MTTLTCGTRTVTASRTSEMPRGKYLLTCHDSETGWTSDMVITAAECRAHMARLYREGWR